MQNEMNLITSKRQKKDTLDYQKKQIEIHEEKVKKIYINCK